MAPQLISIVVFYFLIFLVGVYAGRKRGGGETSGGLLLAGRGMPVLIGVPVRQEIKGLSKYGSKRPGRSERPGRWLGSRIGFN